MTPCILFAAETTELCLLLFRIGTLLGLREFYGEKYLYLASSLSDGCPVN